MATFEAAVRSAREAGRAVLLEPEARVVAEALGIALPPQVVVAVGDDDALTDACALSTTELVVKAIAPELVHKTEVGAVRRVARSREAIATAMAEMQVALADYALEAFSVSEYVAHDMTFGGELMVGLRYTADVGPVVCVAAGGIAAEKMSRLVQAGREMAVLAPGLCDRATIEAGLGACAAVELATQRLRNQPPRVEMAELCALVERMLAFAERSSPEPFSEIEINPLVASGGALMALDVDVRLNAREVAEAAPRPLDALTRLLEPHCIAVVGVSASARNPGAVIVDNILGEGFDRERLWIVKPGHERLAGCRCVAALSDLPERVDLLVVSLPAAAATDVVEEAVALDAAASLLLVAGGFGERTAGEPLEQRLRDAIMRARAGGSGPILNGGNCLGIRSRPGRYDATFVPKDRLERTTQPAPLALLSQSGAFAAAKISKLAPLSPRYVISVGNQVDLTLGDHLEHLAGDDEVKVFACHVEGFAPLDGRRWLAAAQAIARSGRAVVLHRGGRTVEAARAIASHTAAIAGDLVVTRQLATSLGVLWADTLEEFEDLTRLACAFADRSVAGRTLGAMSNAGYEAVALADHLGSLELSPWSDTLRARLADVVSDAGLEHIVALSNPFDTSPMMGDRAFVAAATAIVDDDDVDVAVIGCVPMTPALTTLAAAGEDLEGAGSVVAGLASLWRRGRKAWVAAVDAGDLYDPMVAALEHAGVPTFRSVDRAVRMLARYVAWRRR